MGGREGPSGSDQLNIARIVGVHGVRGGVRMHVYAEESEALRAGLELRLCRESGEEVRRCAVTRLAPKPGSRVVRVWLEGVGEHSLAEALRDLEVWVARADLPPPEEDEYYLADAIGAPVVEGGRNLGTIVGVSSNGMQDLFEVEWLSASGGRRRWLFPALPEFIEAIDEAGVHVDLPPGMLPAELEREKPT